MLTSFQRYDEVTLHRSKIQNAPYNPRTISEGERRRLKKIIAKHGVVSPLVWNERTGNLVAGHQRLAIIDSLERTHDYLIKVAKVNVDDKTEKELNLALNNTAAQGSFDLEKLGDLLKEVDIDGTGWESQDVYEMFGVEGVVEDAEAVSKLAEDLRGLREREKKMLDRQESGENINAIGFYRVLVFPSVAEASAWAEAAGLDPNEIFYAGRGTRLVIEEASEPLENQDAPGES